MDNITKQDKLYITLISVHGLIRSHDLELGRDADTGGQILYVVELARALAAHPDVGRVDLLTRSVVDGKVDPCYAQKEEKICEGAYIIRLECGPRRYLRKEVLWSHLTDFIDRALQHIRNVGYVPDIVHSHYADGGLAGARIAGLLGVPLIHTGHSLGREKLARLLAKGMKSASIEDQYNISTRIEAEEIVLGTANIVIASTKQEVNEQYAAYDNYQPSRMVVIPPGVNLGRFHPPSGDETGSEIEKNLSRFLDNTNKPFILALSRADERKNIASLVHAYGQSAQLQSLANLVIVAGNRDVIADMEKGAREVLTELLLLIDKYDLYGKVAYPKHHNPDDIPILYRLAAKRRGVFVNPALTEPFGLTLIEAAASGLPVVATNDGGPKDILSYCKNGVLIDPLKINDIKKKLILVLSDAERWQTWSEQGITGANRHFSWPGHVQTYLDNVHKLLRQQKRKPHEPVIKSRLPTADRLAFSAIDNALFGDEDSMRTLMAILKKKKRVQRVGFGIATGRSLASTLRFLKRTKLPTPDILITSVGTAIHYVHRDQRLVEDNNWSKHIDYRWEPKALLKVMRRVPGTTLRAASEQTDFKLSYRIDPEVTPTAREIKRLLRMQDLHAKIVITDKKNLDLLPIRASKGLAIRYLAFKWGMPLDKILVVGDSGNDEEMLLGDTLGVVVGNHSDELDKLRGKRRIYFAEGQYSQGIIEGLEYYQFLDEIRIANDEGD